jgi:hypothetical protein
MALDERIALTLYDRMFEVISGKDPDSGLPSAFDSDTTTFIAAQRGLVLNAADYRNPWSPGNPDGSIDAAFNLAQLADDIPAVSPMWSPTGQHVSDVYSKMVNLVHVTEPAPPPEVQARRDELRRVLVEKAVDDEGRPVERPTVLADQEQKAFSDYQDAYMTYVSKWAAAQRDPNLKAVWPIVGAQALQLPRRAFSDWGAAGRDQIDATKDQLATLNTGQVARSFADAQFRLNAYETVAELTDTFFRTTIHPTDWTGADASSWPRYEFSDSTFSSEFSTEATTWGASANVMVGLWSFGGGVDHTDSRQSMAQDTTNIGISFRWRVCPIYRKWMDGTLFSLPNWDLGTLTGAGGISGSPGALMPLIPSAIVMVRDVQITANWSHQDSEHIDTATSGSASVGYGPFGVSGHYAYSSTDDTYGAQRTAQGFTIPDIQILGFVCTRVPHSPPK